MATNAELKQQVDELTEMVSGLKAELAGGAGTRPSTQMRDALVNQALARVELVSMLRGPHKWKIISTKYEDSSGTPASHIYWSDSTDPKVVLSQFKSSAGASNSRPSERDPWEAVLVEKDARPSDFKEQCKKHGIEIPAS